MRTGVGLSTASDTVLATREAVHSALQRAGLKRADWVMCFFSGHHSGHADRLHATLLETSGCLALSGCSAAGVIAEGQEVERRAAVGVLLGSAQGMVAVSNLLPESGAGVAAFAERARETGLQPALFALPDAYRVDNLRLQRRLRQDLTPVPVYGAGATDDGSMGISLQLGMEGVRSASISMLGLYGDLDVAVGITQSCHAVGDPHFITSAHDYVLKELDGRPSLQVFIEQGQALGIDDMQRAAESLLFGFPLNAERPEFVGESCLVRQLGGFDAPSQGLVIPYDMNEQRTMGFMHRSAEAAELDVRRMVTTLQDKLGGPPDFGLYFNCAGRGTGLYGREGVDVEMISTHLGDFPLLGMFGGYELATTHGQPHMYTYTGVLVLVRSR